MKLTRCHIIIIFILFAGLQLLSQQSTMSTMYMLNPYEYNASYAGFDQSISTTLSYRSQWTPIPNSPKKVHFNVHLPVYALNGGVGLKIISESNGIEQHNELALSYNFVYQLGAGYLTGGAHGSIIQKSLNGSEIRTPSGIYEVSIDHQDPILGNQSVNAWTPSAGISVMYNTDLLQSGLQIDHLFTLEPSLDQVNYTFTPVYSIYGAYRVDLSRDIIIRPSLLANYNGISFQTNVGALVEYGNIFGGMSLRGFTPNSFESIGIISGIRFGNHYTLAYSYDLVLNGLQRSTDGTHEIIVKYNLNKLINTGLPPKVIHNPRDL